MTRSRSSSMSSRRRVRTVREPLAANVARELRRILYGMYAIMKLHCAAEEQLYGDVAEEKTHRLRR